MLSNHKSWIAQYSSSDGEETTYVYLDRDYLYERFDEIFGKAIKDYCASEHVEANIDDIPTYKTMNKLITEKLDVLIGEQVKEKRKNL